LYEGDPQDGGTLLAEHRVVPGLLGSSGNVAWFLYTPMELGPHYLYAVVSESGDDLQPGNNIASLKVGVIKEPKGIPLESCITTRSQSIGWDRFRPGWGSGHWLNAWKSKDLP
jgi:hypothetical protein